MFKKTIVILALAVVSCTHSTKNENKETQTIENETTEEKITLSSETNAVNLIKRVS